MSSKTLVLVLVACLVSQAGPARARDASTTPDAGPGADGLHLRSLSPAALQYARQLALGQGRLKILYLGNSRVVSADGLSLAGVQSWTRQRDLLLGSGFIDAGGKTADGSPLVPLLTTNGVRVAHSSQAVQLNTTHSHGVQLNPGKQLIVGGVAPGGLLRASDPLVFTLLYRRGTGVGRFTVTPLAGTSDETLKPLPGGVRTVDAGTPEGAARADFLTIQISGSSAAPVRGIRIQGVSKTSTIYNIHVWSTASRGFMVGHVAVAGHGYQDQMRTTQGPGPRCRREDFVTHLRSFDPDVVVLQYAANQGGQGWLKAARELLGRVREARQGKPFLLLLQLDHSTPFLHSGAMVAASRRDMQQLHQLEPDSLLLNPGSNLPTDWPPQGTRQPGKYFRDEVHENAAGSRAVWEALMLDFTRTLAGLTDLPLYGEELAARGCNAAGHDPRSSWLWLLPGLLLLRRRTR